MQIQPLKKFHIHFSTSSHAITVLWACTINNNSDVTEERILLVMLVVKSSRKLEAHGPLLNSFVDFLREPSIGLG